jgi:hypothetical protein
MENNPAIHQIDSRDLIAQSQNFTVEAVTQKFTTGVPQAFNFGAQVSIFVLATLLAITFIHFLLNRD